VRTAGVEPARGLPLRILSPVCLPVPPRPHGCKCQGDGDRKPNPRKRHRWGPVRQVRLGVEREGSAFLSRPHAPCKRAPRASTSMARPRKTVTVPHLLRLRPAHLYGVARAMQNYCRIKPRRILAATGNGLPRPFDPCGRAAPNGLAPL
jgi:hypothetical protein